MSHPCSPPQLEALVRGELRPAEAALAEAHLAACGPCRHELQWLRYERAAFAARAGQRAAPGRGTAALWRALEARLVPAPPHARWEHAGRMAAGALATAAAVLLMVVGSGAPADRPERRDEPLASYAVGPACLDDGRGAALDATERQFSACLIATPAFP